MLYLQKYSNEFQKLFFGWKMRNVAIVVENLNVHRWFWFCNSNVTTFPISRKCKNFNFSLYTVPAEMLYLQKYLTNLSKTFLLAERRGRWLLLMKISFAQRFWFYNSNATNFPTIQKMWKFQFFPLNCPGSKCYIFKSILRIFKNILFAEG